MAANGVHRTDPQRRTQGTVAHCTPLLMQRDTGRAYEKDSGRHLQLMVSARKQFCWQVEKEGKESSGKFEGVGHEN